MPNTNNNTGNHPVFTEADELHWHQLDLLRRILPHSDDARATGQDSSEEETGSTDWRLSEDLKPYAWQKAALQAWEGNERSGIVKVVTGAGKTVLALMCLERLLRENEALRASIVVPTRVLLDQWYQELTRTLGLPRRWVGRRSGEYKDCFGDGRRVMIYVINSARTALGLPLSTEALKANHFLVVDECHRAGSAENQKIFEVPCRFSLGLSATPERDVEREAASDASDDVVPDVIQQALGPIVYELSFREALREGIIPPFELIHVGVNLIPRERQTYDKLSRELRNLRDRLQQEPAYIKGRLRVHNEFQLIKSLAHRVRSKAGKLAARYEALANNRKELLYQARNRHRCFYSILEEERRAQGVRVMAFHERISQVNRLFESLVRDRMPVVVDHTGLTESQRERSLDLYLRGTAPILLSVKALIEGVNAPATDVGVIVAASASPRQKIQSLGRVMRRYPGKDTSRIYNLYVCDSADENIFRRMNFEQILGIGRVEFRKWLGPGKWETPKGPPYTPLPSDSDLDEEQLEVGEPYPGKDEGLDVSIDTQGTLYRVVADNGGTSKEFGSIPSDVLEAILEIRPGGGRLRITNQRRHVLVPSRNAEGRWEMLYAGRLSEPIQWCERGEKRITLKISAQYGGSVVVAGGSGRKHDVRSPAARRILALVASFLGSEGADIHNVELAPDGGVFARVKGRDHHLGNLGEEDGWPLGKSSFSALRKELSK